MLIHPHCHQEVLLLREFQYLLLRLLKVRLEPKVELLILLHFPLRQNPQLLWQLSLLLLYRPFLKLFSLLLFRLLLRAV